MTFRSGVSSRLSALLLARYRRHLARGSAPSVSPGVWRFVPRFAKAWLSYRVLEDVERMALEAVRTHEVLRTFAPDMEQNRFAMTPSALLYLWNLLEAVAPRRIVAFGSGLSTRLFGEYARRMKARGCDVALLSVEHDAHWLSRTREALLRDRTAEFVVFRHAPITRQPLLGGEIDAYSIDAETLTATAGAVGFELCLIDGPPGTVGRSGCLPLVAPYLAHDAVVLLDDAIRPGEFEICREWKVAFKRQCTGTRLQLLDRHGLMQTKWKTPRLSAASPARTD